VKRQWFMLLKSKYRKLKEIQDREKKAQQLEGILGVLNDMKKDEDYNEACQQKIDSFSKSILKKIEEMRGKS